MGRRVGAGPARRSVNSRSNPSPRVHPSGILAGVIYIDLVGAPEDVARRILLDSLDRAGIRGSQTPSEYAPVPFPHETGGAPASLDTPSQPIADEWPIRLQAPECLNG